MKQDLKYSAAIFDLNGTLIWDTSYHNRAHDVFLERHGIHLTDEEKSLKVHGKPNEEVMRAIFRRELSDEELKALIIEKEQIYQSLIADELRFAPGAEDLFASLRERGIPFTIATSAGIENIDFYFANMPMDRWFDRRKLIYNDGSFRGKPEPDIFVKAAEKLDIPPSKAVIFEDSVAGIIAAERAGAGKVCIVDSNSDDYSRFSHEIITHFDQLDRRIFE